MKSEQIVKSISIRNRILTAIGAAIVALVVFAVAMFTGGAQFTAHAETAGVITIHVYDASEKYDTLGGWVWLKGGSGVEHTISKTAAADEPLVKGSNKARTFTVELSDAQMEALKGGRQLGFLVCVAKGETKGDFWKRYEKEGADVFVDVSQAFDENNHADIYYVRKDTTAYTDLEEGLKALEKIISATFTDKANNSVSVMFETTTPMTAGAKATLYEGDTLLSTANVTIDSKVKTSGTATFSGVKFDFSKEYSMKVSTVPNGNTVSKTGLIDTADFINTFETSEVQDMEFGAVYSKEKTIFRLWAPFATQVMLNIYDNGASGAAVFQPKMKKRTGTPWNGVWEYTFDGDQAGKYYSYTVTNNGTEVETSDPYARACGTDGARAMVIDLETTDPTGWDADKNWYKQNATAVDTPIVWEIDVNDFSSSADSGMKYKGKFLAFTEQNTTVPGKPTLKTGVNYLKELGITYVHLNPVYDFASVDEGDVTRADGGSFNWGYDPQNYNVPEGSYSTDPANGAVRISEFKRMVMALHEAGIGVIMDVVYNHTYNTGGQAFHDTVPFYYHRTNAKGEFTDASGCGNETASERTMMRKFMVESILYWAKEYHIDGFRFDLMGIHDVVTLNMIRDELDKLVLDEKDKTNTGKRILMYGEPWAGYSSYTTESYTKRVNATKTLKTGRYVGNANNKMMKDAFSSASGGNADGLAVLSDRIAVFNGSGRDGLRGECNDRTPYQGWVNGNPGAFSKVRRMIEGGTGGYAEGIHVGVSSRNVAYSCAHDNYTLWDQIRGVRHGNETALYYDEPIEDDVKRCKLVSAAYLMSPGIAFILAGEEMGRTKYGNEDSYNSPIKLNQIVWSRQETFKDLHDSYQTLIKIRKDNSNALFSYKKCTDPDFSGGTEPWFSDMTDGGAFTFTRKKNGTELVMSLDPSTLTGTIKIAGKQVWKA